MTVTVSHPVHVALRWTGRLWGTAVALLGSTFFIEHLAWFNPWTGLPPMRVWLLQGVLLILIAALLSG